MRLQPAQVFEAFERHRLVAVIRAGEAAAALQAAQAVIRGGIALVEITYSVPDAPSVMRQLATEAHPGVIVGPGTLLTAAGTRGPVKPRPRFPHPPQLAP